MPLCLKYRESSFPILHAYPLSSDKDSERAFRVPPRVTYNDTKKLQFLADAGNPSVPLFRLMRDRIPHGFKGVEALDAVFSPPSVPGPGSRGSGAASNATPNDPFPLDRAVWFIKALGANEVLAHRSRVWPVTSAASATSPAGPVVTPGSTAPGALAGFGMTPAATTQMWSNEWYTLEFTGTFTTWLRLQLIQMVLPPSANGAKSAPIAAPAAKPPPPGSKAPGGVLGDEKSRTRWLQKWEYRCVYD